MRLAYTIILHSKIDLDVSVTFLGQTLAKALLCTEKTLVEVYYMQLLIVLRSQEALKIIHAI